MVAAVLDEVAFFTDDAYVVNDRDIYEAVAPRVTVPGGFVAISSTPWAQLGLLYERHQLNWGGRGHCSTRHDVTDASG